MINHLLDFTPAPKYLWFLVALYVAFWLNHMVDVNIYNVETTQYTNTTGRSDYISLLLCFRFFEHVYYLEPPGKHRFPSVFKEIWGQWVDIVKNVGNALPWLVLMDRNRKIHSVLEICSTLDSKNIICLLIHLQLLTLKCWTMTPMFPIHHLMIQIMLFFSIMMGKVPRPSLWIGIKV